MFWNRIAGVYDLFENIYNKKVYNGTGKKVAQFINQEDEVLECACGTGAISRFIPCRCRHFIASDFSEAMLRQTAKKLKYCRNVSIQKTDITALPYQDNRFDKVIAGNVIHLLPDPELALKELERVCKPGGLLIIPTYINDSKNTSRLAVKFLEKLGASFKRQFDAESYRTFFGELGYRNVKYFIVDGRMACDIAVIKVKK